MARKKSTDKSNKSQAIRDLLKEKPDIKAGEAVAALAEKGVEVKVGLFYIVKGKVQAKKQRKVRVVKAAKAASSNGQVDAIALIQEVKALALKAGGYKKLIGLAEALDG